MNSGGTRGEIGRESNQNVSELSVPIILIKRTS